MDDAPVMGLNRTELQRRRSQSKLTDATGNGNGKGPLDVVFDIPQDLKDQGIEGN